MDAIINNNKEYERISIELDPMYDELVLANKIVIEYIKEKSLILYGGMAIDFALRLQGDKIYSDETLKTPDLDFYSPNVVEDAYNLADILYDNGYIETRAINAEHAGTLKVDCGDRHFVADISYKPEKLFNMMPTLMYQGIKIIHPDYQRIDIHHSLSHPFSNPPREVIFNRWEKDIKRFNILDTHYPITYSGNKNLPKKKTITITQYDELILTGFAAYAIICEYYMSKGGEYKSMMERCTKETFTCPEFLKYTEYMSDAPELFMLNNNIKCGNIKAQLSNIKRKRYYGVGIKLHDVDCEQISMNCVSLYGIEYKIVNVQIILEYFLSCHFSTKNDKKKVLYKNYYANLLEMIKNSEEDMDSPLYLSIQVYGKINDSRSHRTSIKRILKDIGEIGALPSGINNYYPGRSRPRGLSHPIYKKEDIEFFHENGQKLNL